MLGDPVDDPTMDRVTIRSLRIVANGVVPYLSQDGCAVWLAEPEGGEVPILPGSPSA